MNFVTEYFVRRKQAQFAIAEESGYKNALYDYFHREYPIDYIEEDTHWMGEDSTHREFYNTGVRAALDVIKAVEADSALLGRLKDHVALEQANKVKPLPPKPPRPPRRRKIANMG